MDMGDGTYYNPRNVQLPVMSRTGSEWTSISLKPPLREELRRMKDERDDADSYDSLLRAELGLEENNS